MCLICMTAKNWGQEPGDYFDTMPLPSNGPVGHVHRIYGGGRAKYKGDLFKRMCKEAKSDVMAVWCGGTRNFA